MRCVFVKYIYISHICESSCMRDKINSIQSPLCFYDDVDFFFFFRFCLCFAVVRLVAVRQLINSVCEVVVLCLCSILVVSDLLGFVAATLLTCIYGRF